MPPPVEIILDVSWGTFMLVWLIGALRTKREAYLGGAWWGHKPLIISRMAMALAIIVLSRLVLANRGVDERDILLFRPQPALAWIAEMLTVGGIGYAIWARVHLGRNWSPHPSRKEGHELITSGPYRLVRHPIYTGMLLALLGLTFTGNVAGPVVLVISLIVLLRRVVREERIMMELFPACYPIYRNHTWRLIPHVW